MGGRGIDRWTKHPDYHFSDGSVSILTGQTLFRVHRSFFERESEIFLDLFTTAAAEAPEAGSDDCPFTLKGVTPDEFAHFLWVWYDREYSYREQPKEKWVTILTLAKRWDFPKIKKLAVREIEALALAPAERISLYNEHGIEGDGLMSSYVELCKSPKVTEAEGRLIEMETLIKVLQARETALCTAAELGHESPTSASLEDDALKEIITSLFKKGLNPPSDGSSTGSGAQASDLNGERARGARPTITLNKPQVPDRTQSANGAPSHSTDPTQTGSKGKKSQDQENGEADKATGGNMHEEKLAKEAQEKLNQDAAKQTKEKEAKAKVEKEKQEKEAKEKEEKAKAEKAKREQEKAAKEKEEKERAEKAEKAKREQEKAEQKLSGNSRSKTGHR